MRKGGSLDHYGPDYEKYLYVMVLILKVRGVYQVLRTARSEYVKVSRERNSADKWSFIIVLLN